MTVLDCGSRKVLSGWGTLTLLLYMSVGWAAETDSSHRSLIHRPHVQATPSVNLDLTPSHSRSDAHPAPPSPPLPPPQHKLLKKPATSVPTVAQTGAIFSSSSLLSDTSPSMNQAVPTGTTPVLEAKPSSGALVGRIAATPVPAFEASARSSAQTASATPRTSAAVGSHMEAPRLPGPMQRLLRSNPSFGKLLKAPTPDVSTPPPSTTPPPASSIGSATLTWTANKESDLAGYYIHVGTASGTYTFPGSPFRVGKVTTYTVTNLKQNTTYFFAASAYDFAGNESPLSAEVSKSIF